MDEWKDATVCLLIHNRHVPSFQTGSLVFVSRLMAHKAAGLAGFQASNLAGPS